MTKLQMGALVALATMSQLLAGCTAKVDYGETAFACTDGECIPGLATLRFDNTFICVTLHANTHLSNGAQIRLLRSVVLLI